jgi:hypothetical protein
MEEQEEKTTAQEQPQEVQPVKKQRKIGKPIHDLLEGDFLSKKGVVRNLPFLFFLAVIAIIYIANTYYAEKTFKEIENTKNELKELRYQYITTKSNLMYQSKQVEIAKQAEVLGLKETLVPPYKVYYTRDSLNGKTVEE